MEIHKVPLTSTAYKSNSEKLENVGFCGGMKTGLPGEKKASERGRGATNQNTKVGLVIGRFNEIVELTRLSDNKVAVLMEWQYGGVSVYLRTKKKYRYQQHHKNPSSCHAVINIHFPSHCSSGAIFFF